MVVVPSGQAGAVKAVEAGGRGVSFACAGDSADLSLSGVDTQVRWPGFRVLLGFFFIIRLGTTSASAASTPRSVAPALAGN